MRFMSFRGPTGPEPGMLDEEGKIVPLGRGDHPALASIQELIESGDLGLELAGKALRNSVDRLDSAAVIWEAPLPVPVQMRDFLVFEDHMRMAGWRGAQLRACWGAPAAPPQPMPIPEIWYQQPIYYKCNRFAVMGTGQTIAWPQTSTVIDYELEMACVIGRGGRNISTSNAADHIFGFTIFNDLTARDLQFREMQGPLGPAKGKDFDGANVLGPVIVTRDELGDNPDLAMRAWVNGELWSEGHSGSMHWSWGQIIEHASRDETLHPGEVLASGTVGAGCGLELGRMLCHDDEVRLEIEGIGSIMTRIDAPHVLERMVL